jgi:hypothetical protein
MACFLAPTAAAIVTSNIKKRIDPKYHLDWLNNMFWGGVVMLIVEHISHGEVVFYPPFFTAMKNPKDTLVMLKEISTIGVGMTIAIFIVWAIMVLVANKITNVSQNKIQSVTV